MNLRTLAGDGVLAREGELVLFCTPTDDPADAVLVDELLEAVRMVADEGGDGSALADAVSGVATGSGLSLVAFAPSAGSLVVSVFGLGWAIVATEHGEQRLAPRHAPPDGLRSMVPGAVLTIRAGVGDVSGEAVGRRWTELRSGVTRAGGLVLSASDEPLDPPHPMPAARTAPTGPVDFAEVTGGTGSMGVSTEPSTEALPVDDAALPPEAPPADAARAADPATEAADAGTGPPSLPSVPAPAVAVDRTEPFSAVVLVGSPSPAQPREPLPIATRPPEPDAPEAPVPAHPPSEDNAVVIGVYCKNGHFDDPAARYCAVCGISMAQQTLVPRPGPRPPLGVLVLDDGSIFSLDADYVVGRDPSRDPDVISGAARPLRIDDPEGLLSRVHARIHLDGWDVAVVDLGSSNGTGLWGPHDSAWTRAPEQSPVVVRPGTQIGVGRRQMRYESHRNT
ncbi:FHA domain-containing protein [Jatrophihabitans endophyticus]|uniref:FHA domain-containing protein n=1 Tax=Jatrophihabitans endophyticus TaxID=1206085 RepID=UPI001A0A5D65|nr:FHA domain-containing protein [Jatrophihabitans endophyticus]MBE7189190.1 FHA domain-containing protein [Jatrophihabitans endophyticus]